jgi:D-hydroxyproline dehydrogenase subunit alpha
MRTVIIIGGGPAGLAAAAAALDRGASVTLLEAAARLGGQFWRHPADIATADPGLQHNWQTFRSLADRISSDPSATVIADAQVWAIDHDQNAPRVQVAIGAADGPERDMITVTGTALIIATGAHDLTLPFPGWDLPGVFTGGAAQSMAKAEHIAIGRRVLVAGAGPFLLPVATSLTSVGARVVGVYEASKPRTLAGGWLPRAPWLATKGPELGGYLATLARQRIRYRTGWAVVRAHGNDAVDGVTISRIDRNWRPVAGTAEYLEVDTVCVSHGFTPRLELAVAAGCALSPDRFVIIDDGQRTSVAGVFAAGETTGIGGSDTALVEGRIAGHVAAGGSVSDHELRSAVRKRRTLGRLASAIRDGHRIGRDWTSWLTDDTVICRCEEVRYGRFRATLDSTRSRGLRPVKLSTRAGLGPCQGRICGHTVEQMITAGSDQPSTDQSSTDQSSTDGVIIDRRPIAVPVRFAELAIQPREILPKSNGKQETQHEQI